jgi:ribonuclease BN (tRNA processing enzyme)
VLDMRANACKNMIHFRSRSATANMRLKVLGAYGTTDATHNLTGYVIDDRIAVDAGTLSSRLTLVQQARIEMVYITHAHADHTRDLCHLILNRFHQDAPPLSVLAMDSVMDELMAYYFNGKIWPDFTQFDSPVTGKRALEYRPLIPGKKTTVGGVSFTPVPVNHTVPAAGVIIGVDSQTIVFTGDTGPTSDIWKRSNRMQNVAAVITEASFPNDYHDLATDSGHLTPHMLEEELRKIRADAPVYASHRKLPYENKIESEIRNIRDRRARILVEKQYTF